MQRAAQRKPEIKTVKVVKWLGKFDWERTADKTYGYKYCCPSPFFQFMKMIYR